MGVGIVRQHLRLDEIFDKGQGAPGRSVISIDNFSLPIGCAEQLIVADNGVPNGADQLPLFPLRLSHDRVRGGVCVYFHQSCCSTMNSHPHGVGSSPGSDQNRGWCPPR